MYLRHHHPACTYYPEPTKKQHTICGARLQAFRRFFAAHGLSEADLRRPALRPSVVALLQLHAVRNAALPLASLSTSRTLYRTLLANASLAVER